MADIIMLSATTTTGETTTMIQNLETAAPVVIDSALAELHLDLARAEQRRDSALTTLRRALGQVECYAGRRRYYPISAADTLTDARARAERGEKAPSFYSYKPLAELVDQYDTAVVAVKGVEAEMAPLDAEYARRPWSRFFVVQNNNGHVHSSMSCQTCNRGGQATSFGWNPDLSGLTEADAVANLGPMLCTVCFPSAPVEWVAGKAEKPGCPGSRLAPADDVRKRYGMRTYAKCSGCGEQQLMSGPYIRKHPPKTA